MKSWYSTPALEETLIAHALLAGLGYHAMLRTHHTPLPHPHLTAPSLHTQARHSGALALGTEALCLRRIYFLQPLLPGGGASEVACEVDTSAGRFEVRSRRVAAPAFGTELARGDSPAAVHCAGDAAAGGGALVATTAASVRRCAAVAVDPARLYSELRSVGLEYGPRYRPLLAVWCPPRGGGACAARLRRQAGPTAVVAHPSSVDAALQLTGLLATGEKGGREGGGRGGGGGGLRLPFSVSAASFRRARGPLCAFVAASGPSCAAVRLCSSAEPGSAPPAAIDGFESREVPEPGEGGGGCAVLDSVLSTPSPRE